MPSKMNFTLGCVILFLLASQAVAFKGYSVCYPNPCEQQGRCVDFGYSYVCYCPEPYTGQNCELLNDCSSNPCEQQAQCVGDDSGYLCYCPESYTGQNCELRTNGDPSCGNYYESTGNIASLFYPDDYGGTPECNYHLKIRTAKEITLIMQDFVTDPDQDVLIFGEGPEVIYEGPNVTSITGNLTGLPLIERTYTFTNNQIFLTFSSGRVSRQTRSFSITYAADIDSCMSFPCPLGLICKDGHYNYTCESPAEITIVTECIPDLCRNGGSCEDQTIGIFTCQCSPGYTSYLCETNINECSSQPCWYGSCEDQINGFTCQCSSGFTGEFCETDIFTDCSSDPCLNGGSCEDQIGGIFTCQCSPGYTSYFCETNINECSSRPCVYGSCEDHINGFTCQCSSGFTGEFCETNINECSSRPCVYGSCEDHINGFTCQCSSGFTGEFCETKRSCPNVTMETVFGQARLPMTDVGIVIDSEELCPEESSKGLAAPIVGGVCQVSSNGTTYWNTSIRCQDDITRQLMEILMLILLTHDMCVSLYLENGIYDAYVAEDVFTITKNYKDITATDICFLYEILQLMVDLNSDANITGLIVGIVNNVMFVDEDVLASAQENGSCTALIVQVLESQLNTVVVGNSTLDAAYPNIAVQVLDVPSDTAGDGIVITMLSMDTGSLSNSDIMVGTHQDTPTDSVPRDTFARVVVPIEVGESAIESIRVAFVVYANDAMFPSPSLALLNREIGTPVVSLTIGGQKIENLMERVNITFYRFKSDSHDPTCNFWEFILGHWSMAGCQLLPDNAVVVNISSDEYYTCACNHLTNFAVLVDIYAEDDPPKPALRLLSIIGCAVSCVCLVIAIASYLSVEKIRRSQTHKIFICLCTTLLCLYTVSLAIIALDTEYQHAEVEWIPCTVLAALLHYFVLSSLTWMGIEGFNTYLVIVKVFNPYIPKFMIKASIVGWGIPAVIVAATGGITRNYYAVEDYCYIRKWPLIGGLLAPMAIILIINITVFILAMCRLENSARMAGRVKKDYKTERQETRERIQNGIAMLLLLGFTWTTGYLTMINVDYTELLFIIFNSLQGFFIFVLYCLRKETIRKQWRRCICCALLRDGVGVESQGNSGRTPGFRSGNGGSQPMFESSSAISHTNPSFEYAN